MIRFALPIAFLAAYGASPYVSLYEMGQDVRHGDASALCAHIDWNRVRDGLKEDIADDITGEPAVSASTAPASNVTISPATANNDDLPPFGSGFVTSMAGSVVDRTVTARHLTDSIGAMHAAHASARPTLEGAYFTSPTSFSVSLRPAGSAGAEPVRLRLDLEQSATGLRWQVTRAWIPAAMLEKSETHAS
jgi:hypothetical protein